MPRVREAEEFAAQLTARPPTNQQGPLIWSLESIRVARDEQMRGHFKLPVRLAEAMRTDDSLFNAYRLRTLPQLSLSSKLVPAPGTRGEVVARKAAVSVFAASSVLAGIHGTLANHGVAIGYIEHQTDDDGTRTDFRLVEWPLEHVRWNNSRRQLETQTLSGQLVDIVHGDGTWVVFRAFHDLPWTQHACVIPGALVWASHANGLRDLNASTAAHGMAKIIGEMPSGAALKNELTGTLTPQAEAFLQLLVDVVTGAAPAGIRPAGAKTEFISNADTAWQIFQVLIENRDKAATRTYLGTDAILGSNSGAPGVDISELFRVASTILQGDLNVIEQALRTGLYEPWCAINFGDSQYAPRFEYQIPDPDANEKAEQSEARLKGLLDVLERFAKDGFELTQDTINDLAAMLGVTAPPKLPAIAARATTVNLASADVAKVVLVSEARQSQGFLPFGDYRDSMTVAELDQQVLVEVAKIKAQAQTDAASVKAAPAAPPPPDTPAAPAAATP